MMPIKSLNEQYTVTELHAALKLQMNITAVVTRGGGVDRLLMTWEEQTNEPVAVFGRLGKPLGWSRNFSSNMLSEASESFTKYLPKLGEIQKCDTENCRSKEMEISSFAGNDIVRGYLARCPAGDGSASLAVPALRSLLALEYERHWLLDEPARRDRATRFKKLFVLGEEGGAQAYLKSLGIDWQEVRSLAISVKDRTQAEVLIDDLAILLSTSIIHYDDQIVECLVPSDPRETLIEYGFEGPIGIGATVAPRNVSHTIQQARFALETSIRIGTSIEYRDGSSHDFLIQVASPEYLDSFADTILAPLEASRNSATLLRTLNLWLTRARSVEATASELAVHRHTVRNRIHKISLLLARDLENIDVQTELWLALKVRGAQQN